MLRKIMVMSVILALILAIGCAKEEPKRVLITIDEDKDVSFINRMDKPVTFLLLGSDSRSEDSAGLSDSIIIARIDPGTGASAIVSIPRDSRVNIPGHGFNKLNSAMVFGGPQLTVKTIEDLIGIEIDYHVVTTFFGFSRIVNGLGGVDMEIAEPISDPWSGADIPAGTQHLDGQSALALARTRHIPDGDFARMANQQKILLSLWGKTKEADFDIANLFSIVTAIDGNVASIIDPSHLFIIANAVLSMNPTDCRSIVIRGDIRNIDGVSFVIVDQNQLLQAKRALSEL